MTEIEVNNKLMEALKTLSETSMKISEASGTLQKIREQETEYLIEREASVMTRINMLVEDVNDLLTDAHTTCSDVTRLHTTASEFCTEISRIYGELQSTVVLFEKQSDMWNKKYAKQVSELSELRKQMMIDQAKVINDREGVQQARKALEREKKVIESRQAQIKSALQVLKNKQ